MILPLAPAFYARDTVRVARGLLGCVLESRVRGATVSGRIVEVEAYLGPHDPAAHGYRNRQTARNAPMFGPPGHAYVYFIYGMHWCVNAVTGPEGYPAAVLIRALEPLTGERTMARRRRLSDRPRLCSGPARLCQALGITGRLNGVPLQGPLLRILPRDRARGGLRRVVAGPRIGVRRAADWPLRFVLAGSEYTSRAGGDSPGAR